MDESERAALGRGKHPTQRKEDGRVFLNEKPQKRRTLHSKYEKLSGRSLTQVEIRKGSLSNSELCLQRADSLSVFPHVCVVVLDLGDPVRFPSLS
jgi:hypothetical protein